MATKIWCLTRNTSAAPHALLLWGWVVRCTAVPTCGFSSQQWIFVSQLRQMKLLCEPLRCQGGGEGTFRRSGSTANTHCTSENHYIAILSQLIESGTHWCTFFAVLNYLHGVGRQQWHPEEPQGGKSSRTPGSSLNALGCCSLVW